MLHNSMPRLIWYLRIIGVIGQIYLCQAQLVLRMMLHLGQPTPCNRPKVFYLDSYSRLHLASFQTVRLSYTIKYTWLPGSPCTHNCPSFFLWSTYAPFTLSSINTIPTLFLTSLPLPNLLHFSILVLYID